MCFILLPWLLTQFSPHPVSRSKMLLNFDQFAPQFWKYVAVLMHRLINTLQGNCICIKMHVMWAYFAMFLFLIWRTSLTHKLLPNFATFKMFEYLLENGKNLIRVPVKRRLHDALHSLLRTFLPPSFLLFFLAFLLCFLLFSFYDGQESLEEGG